jgi:hypothetical protein
MGVGSRDGPPALFSGVGEGALDQQRPVGAVRLRQPDAAGRDAHREGRLRHRVRRQRRDARRPEWNGLYVRGSSGTDLYSRDSVREDLARSERRLGHLALRRMGLHGEPQGPVRGRPAGRGLGSGRSLPGPAVALRLALQRPHGDRDEPLRLRPPDRAVGRVQEVGRVPFPVRYAPHAVDDVFVPTPSDFRETIDVPDDAFLVGIVAANVGTASTTARGSATWPRRWRASWTATPTPTSTSTRSSPGTT